MSLDELEKATQALENPVELQKDLVRQHWKSHTIRDTLRHVRDAWKEGRSPASEGRGRSSVCTSPSTSGDGWISSPHTPQLHSTHVRFVHTVGELDHEVTALV